ncbi:MAG: hypothetical protein HY730_03445 [Candidatus Tectomicrobia bacterium]|uniref:Uncharacterized protein n=1 Tax=Tectimicrobiota bacterium TaxID=2528274 RepID=A0A933GMS8_UNCTE|nr:hypothetical protein [Candidatus Tectomicrobia bacterium]
MKFAYLITFFLSFLVAFAELLSKFKDEPLAIFKQSLTAWLYIFMNVLIALLAFYLLTRTRFLGTTEIDMIKAALTAGLGSTMLMRSKFFKVNINGKEAAIGPEIIINIFLETLEKMIDRKRALKRKDLVEQCRDEIDFKKTKDYAVTTLLASLQTVSAETTKKLIEEAEKIGNSPIGEIEKSHALGYLILDNMGEEFLRGFFNKKTRPNFVRSKEEIEANKDVH